MGQEIFISNSILEWDALEDITSLVDNHLWKRAYEMWERSCTLIENANSAFDLSDGILTLKRSMDQRLKLIEELYSLKMIEYENKPKGYIELLSDYKLTRPYIMKKLLSLRNDIEHNDA